MRNESVNGNQRVVDPAWICLEYSPLVDTTYETFKVEANSFVLDLFLNFKALSLCLCYCFPSQIGRICYQLPPLTRAHTNTHYCTHSYVHTTKSNVKIWIGNALEGETVDWTKADQPNTDPNGYYCTDLPAHIFKIIGDTVKVGCCCWRFQTAINQ